MLLLHAVCVRMDSLGTITICCGTKYTDFAQRKSPSVFDLGLHVLAGAFQTSPLSLLASRMDVLISSNQSGEVSLIDFTLPIEYATQSLCVTDAACSSLSLAVMCERFCH